MSSDGRAQLESRITRGTRTIPAPLHPVPTTAEPVMDAASAADAPERDHPDSSSSQPTRTAMPSAGPGPQHSDTGTIPPQGTAFSGPATQPLYVRVHPEITDWLEAVVTELRRHRTSRAEVIEMLLWEERHTPSDQFADRLRAFRWETGRR